MPGLKAGFGRLATLGQLFDILGSHLPALESETVELKEAHHRVLAEDVRAEIDVPHFAKSAMDGYAVIASETFGAGDAAPKVLDVIASVTPGDNREIPVTPGSCIEIGTGAPLPPGADAIVMVEYTEPNSDGRVSIRKGVAPRENVVEIGSDVSQGETVLARGTPIEPRHLGVLAAVGAFKVRVFRRPRVALFSTGPEIIEAGATLEPSRIFDINSHTLRGALIDDGCEVIELGIVPDEMGALRTAIDRGLAEADLVLLSGGSSLGGGDLVTEAFDAIGQMLLHGVAVKPGKPVVVGVAKGKTLQGVVEKLLIGLPGYPMSALSDYYIFVRPSLRKAMGLRTEPAFVEAVLARKHPSTVGRYEFLPVRLEAGEAHPITKGSSSISAMADADGFVEIDENTEVVEKGEPVRVRLF
jgi:molybdenum cofactor synthesis domain-containing protein